MKKGMILLIFLISILVVQAKSVDQLLNNQESHEIPGYNLTLISISANKDNVAVCVNNQKYIMGKNEPKKIDDIKIELVRIYENSAEIKFVYSNDELTCGESCSNAACFSQPSKTAESDEEQENTTKTTVTAEQPTKNKFSNLTVVSIGLMVLAIILVLIFFSKKKR